MSDLENQSSTAVEHSDSNSNQPPDHSGLKNEGYVSLASWYAEQPSNAIYKRFGTLNALNLLYLQAELAMLEIQLQQYAAEDANSTDEIRTFHARNWKVMSNQRRRKGRNMAQWKTFMKIRRALREYNREFLAQAQIARLPKVSCKTIDLLTEWVEDPCTGCVYLEDDTADFLRNTNPRDLIAIKPIIYDDAVSDWAVSHGIDFWHKFFGRFYKKNKKDSIANGPMYSTQKIERFVAAALIMLASTFPIISICVLYRVKPYETRLWILCGFTLLFAACVGAFNPGKRIETFAATMAFAAVQVVFITNSTPT